MCLTRLVRYRKHGIFGSGCKRHCWKRKNSIYCRSKKQAKQKSNPWAKARGSVAGTTRGTVETGYAAGHLGSSVISIFFSLVREENAGKRRETPGGFRFPPPEPASEPALSERVCAKRSLLSCHAGSSFLDNDLRHCPVKTFWFLWNLPLRMEIQQISMNRNFPGGQSHPKN